MAASVTKVEDAESDKSDEDLEPAATEEQELPVDGVKPESDTVVDADGEHKPEVQGPYEAK